VTQGLELLFLGTGNGFATAGRYYSSFLLNGRYLFDCSPVTVPHLKQAGVPPEQIEAVFISHFHADHFLGLPFLLLDYAQVSHRTAPLTIVGPPGIEQRLAAVTDATLPTLLHKERTYAIEYVEASDGATGQVGDMLFIARQVTHSEGLECFGYRADVGGRTLAYSGDTSMCDAIVALASGADVFVLECSCWDEPECRHHLTLTDVRELRRRLGPAPAFVLTHVGTADRTVDIENTRVAEDLATLQY
jgi:ribonuclease BN (tRNA processing enzyme)